ncbi:hypothetical protein [Hoeflea ulvae]|uniref:Transposase n=1 Tax=Hoeflea ulvae TaxID=2983764 RepID=A0ABT3YIX2_9HYPH|nr:hypothetical protein [Hoeflea ulvae]MCY0095729.1 hypothetical protein [Hoeflea ulvae]
MAAFAAGACRIRPDELPRQRRFAMMLRHLRIRLNVALAADKG